MCAGPELFLVSEICWVGSGHACMYISHTCAHFLSCLLVFSPWLVSFACSSWCGCVAVLWLYAVRFSPVRAVLVRAMISMGVRSAALVWDSWVSEWLFVIRHGFALVCWSLAASEPVLLCFLVACKGEWRCRVARALCRLCWIVWSARVRPVPLAVVGYGVRFAAAGCVVLSVPLDERPSREWVAS